MASLTVRDIEDDVEAALRRRAARRGVSVENEIRDILRQAAREGKPAAKPSVSGEAERQARIARLMAFAHPPLPRFDLKALSDAISDGMD